MQQLSPHYFIGDYNDTEDVRYKFEMKGTNELIVVGINPSTARADPKGTEFPKKDATIRKIIGFLSRKRGRFSDFDGFLMLNLSVQSSIEPAKLQESQNKALHERNLQKIESYLKELKKSQEAISVLLAYGDAISNGKFLKNNLCSIVSLFQQHSTHFFRLGDLTKKGNPRHPLYLSYNTKLVEITNEELSAFLK